MGTFVKEFEAPPYGSGRVIWTYEEDRVLGRIEASVMGVEVELATEAEYSLSSNGTIYGVLTACKVDHIRIPEAEEFAELKPYVGLWPLVEPLVDEVTTDLPFSYQFRVGGDRLSIQQLPHAAGRPEPAGQGRRSPAIGDGGLATAGRASRRWRWRRGDVHRRRREGDRSRPKKRPILRKPAPRARGDSGSGKALGELLGRVKNRSVGPVYTPGAVVGQLIPGPVLPGAVLPANPN